MVQAIFLCLLLLSISLQSSSAQAKNCSSESFSGNRRYSSCNSLPYLGASLHWTYHASDGTVDVAYRAPQSSSGWVAWAINPSGAGMIGANAFLAFPDSATGAVTVWTTQLSTYPHRAEPELELQRVHQGGGVLQRIIHHLRDAGGAEQQHEGERSVAGVDAVREWSAERPLHPRRQRQLAELSGSAVGACSTCCG
ncbi:unnamed protein product [Musa textilis]